MRPFTTVLAMIFLTMAFLVTTGDPCYGQNQSFGGWGDVLQGITGDRAPRRPQSDQVPSGLSGIFGNGNSKNVSTPKLFGELPNLIPNWGGNGGQPGQNDILSRMNRKSKDAIDRTTNWAQQKKQEMSAKMFSGAFDMLKPKSSQGLQGGQASQGAGLLQGASGAFDWLKPKANQPLNQPPIRSAENYGQQPSVRY